MPVGSLETTGTMITTGVSDTPTGEFMYTTGVLIFATGILIVSTGIFNSTRNSQLATGNWRNSISQ